MNIHEDTVPTLPTFEYILPPPQASCHPEWGSVRRFCHGRIVVGKHAVDQWCSRAPKASMTRGKTGAIRVRILRAVVRGHVWRTSSEVDGNTRFDIHDPKTGMVVRVVSNRERRALWVATTFIFKTAGRGNVA